MYISPDGSLHIAAASIEATSYILCLSPDQTELVLPPGSYSIQPRGEGTDIDIVDDALVESTLDGVERIYVYANGNAVVIPDRRGESKWGVDFRSIKRSPTGPICGTCGDRLRVTSAMMDEDPTLRPWYHGMGFSHRSKTTTETSRCFVQELEIIAKTKLDVVYGA